MQERKHHEIERCSNIYEAVEGCLSVDIQEISVSGNRPLKLGLQRHLMKVAGIEEGEL